MRRPFWILVGALTLGGVGLLGVVSTDRPDYSLPPSPRALDPRFDGFVAEGAEITLHYMGANRGCERLVDLAAEETAKEIRLTLIEERHSKARFCTAEGVFLTATVQLEEPLGDRSVVDATSDQPLAPLAADDWRRKS